MVASLAGLSGNPTFVVTQMVIIKSSSNSEMKLDICRQPAVI